MSIYSDQAHFGDYWPPDFGWGARDPRVTPSLLVPFSHSGVSFGSCHVDFVPQLKAFLDELVPLIKGGLVAGECGIYNPNSVSSGGERSFHTWAIAADINWGYNPMAATNPPDEWDLPAQTHAIAFKYGMEWGGDWTVPKDWMHVETHLRPEVARTVKSLSTSTATALEEIDMFIVHRKEAGTQTPELGVLVGDCEAAVIKSPGLEAAYRRAGVPARAVSPADYDVFRTLAGAKSV